MKGLMSIFISFERVNILSFLSLHGPQIYHEHCRRIFTMLRKDLDLQHVNWPSLVVSSPSVSPVWTDTGHLPMT